MPQNTVFSAKMLSNFRGLVLFFIKADFCNQILVVFWISVFSIFQDLQDSHTFAPLPIQNIRKTSSNFFKFLFEFPQKIMILRQFSSKIDQILISELNLEVELTSPPLCSRRISYIFSDAREMLCSSDAIFCPTSKKSNVVMKGYPCLLRCDVACFTLATVDIVLSTKNPYQTYRTKEVRSRDLEPKATGLLSVIQPPHTQSSPENRTRKYNCTN